MIRTTSRPTVPTTLLLAVLVAVTAFVAFTALASAETKSRPNKYDPDGFSSTCQQIGGTPTEVLTPSGGVLESYCTFDNGDENSCNWITGWCTYSYVPEPSGEVGRPPIGGELLDDTPGTTQPRFGDVAAPPTGGVLDRAP